MNTVLKSVLLLFVSGLLTLAPGQKEHADMKHENISAKMKDHSPMKHKGKMTPEMKAHANKMYSAYLNIASSLAADSLAPALKSVEELLAEAGRGDAGKKNPGHHKKMQPLLKALGEAQEIETLRNAFRDFSKEFIPHMQSMKKALDKDFRVFYCPMKKGGHWLQDKTPLRNPYYGAEMLECGSEVTAQD